MANLKKIFNPDTVALVGATEKEGSIGRVVLENLMTLKDRKLFPINPSRETVLGLPCFKRIGDVPEPVDLVVIVTPAATVPGTIEECGKAGVRGVIIISAGFKEIGEEGKELEIQIEKIRAKYGMRIIGPNCLGLIRPSIGLNATFARAMPQQGKIAFISHSGALGSAMLDWALDNHIGFSSFVSLGSMLDVDFGDLIDYLGEDPETKSIMIYMEGVGNARKFMSAARGFARTKPIIILKPGKFKEGAKAAQSHTGAMTGDDQVYDAAFKRAGMVRVKEIDDLFNCASVLDSKLLPAGSNLALITNAGGPGAITTDWIIEMGGRLATLSDNTLQRLNEALPKFWSHGNPVDVLGDSDSARYMNALSICLEDPGVDGVLIIYTPQGPSDPAQLATAISSVAKNAAKPVITAFMGGSTVDKAREIFVENSIPTYYTPELAVKTYFYMYKYKRNLEQLYETPAELSVDLAPPKNSLKTLIRTITREGRTALTEEESKRFFTAYKIPATNVCVAKSAKEAAIIAEEEGYPVVMKIASPDVLHKTDVGGVVLNLTTEKDVKEEYKAMIARVKKHMPEARITGVTIQSMVKDVDYEIILGAKKDRQFGTVILFGMGGVTAEIFKDFSIALPPLNQTLARRLMEETKVYKMLQGYRGKKAVDFKQLEQIIVSFANLIIDFPEIAEVDINPIAISNGVPIALDARILLDKESLEPTSLYQHLVITPYPSKYIVPFLLTDNTQVVLRPIRPEDEPLEYEMLASLSAETIRLHQMPDILNHTKLVRFCNIDYGREMALVAELREGDKRRIVGVGRIIMEADSELSNFLMLVHDDYQNRGLGRKLLDELIGIAQERKMDVMYGSVLTENQRAIHVCTRAGFEVKNLEGGISRVELVLT